MPDNASLLDKANMLDLTPFEETLFLDADTVVMDNPELDLKRQLNGVGLLNLRMPLGSTLQRN